MSKKLLGVEFCRGLSTYAVVLVHSGDETWGFPIDPAAIAFRLHFYFAVPFFLAASFYFMTAKPDIGYSSKFWRSRIERVVAPYAVWTAVFLILRIAVFTVGNKPDRLQQLLGDPLAIIFLGGASYHLYFLPLLLAGTSLILLMPFLEKLRLGKWSLLALASLSIAAYYALEVSGNSFNLGANTAFENLLNSLQTNPDQYPPLRLLLVEIAWIIRCLPYFLLSLTLRFFQSTKNLHSRSSILGWGLLFLLFDVLSVVFLPGALAETLLAYTLLLFSISLSSYFKEGKAARLVSNVGACSFGIYLMHPLIMNFVKPLIHKALPEVAASVSIVSMLVLSIPCFLMSWTVVACLIKNRQVAKYLFGT